MYEKQVTEKKENCRGEQDAVGDGRLRRRFRRLANPTKHTRRL